MRFWKPTPLTILTGRRSRATSSTIALVSCPARQGGHTYEKKSDILGDELGCNLYRPSSYLGTKKTVDWALLGGCGRGMSRARARRHVGTRFRRRRFCFLPLLWMHVFHVLDQATGGTSLVNQLPRTKRTFYLVAALNSLKKGPHR